MDTGHTAWLLMSSALVLFMTPGLAFFYGGMVRGRNVLAMLMKNYVAMGVVTVTWILVGYSLAFSGDWQGLGLIGNLEFFALGELGFGTEIGLEDGEGIPDSVFLLFQLMFAIITPALISGAVAERMKFTSWVVFIAVWSIVVYAPMAHWVWGGGFIGSSGGTSIPGIGALDFAGGLVVHINAGVAALALVLVLGPRLGWRRDVIRPHALPFTVLGAGMLWFGWFGFNAGSALAADGAAGNAFLTTQIAAAVAALTWALAEQFKHGRPTTLGFASGAVAGLVAITPAAGFVSPLWALVIGVAAGVICFLALQIKFRYGFDDSLDVVASPHGGRHRRRAVAGAVRGSRDRRHRRRVLRQRGAAAAAGDLDRGRARVLVRRDVRDRGYHRPDDGLARLRGRGAPRPRCSPA